MSEKLQLKAVFITEDGESFLCIRQFYANDLRTGTLLDGKQYQGRRFRLIPEEKEKVDGRKTGDI